MAVRYFGHSFDDRDGDAELELSSVHMVCDADTLRALADFLHKAATRMDQYGDRFNQEVFEADAAKFVISRRYVAD
jgi:hypothetical protein